MSNRIRRTLVLISLLSGSVLFTGTQLARAEECPTPPTGCDSGLDCVGKRCGCHHDASHYFCDENDG